MDYHQYSLTHFLEDPSFRAWVLDKDPDARSFWTKWLQDHPDRAGVIDDARAMLLALQEKPLVIDEDEIAGRVARTLEKLPEGLAQPVRDSGRKLPLWRWTGMAAAIALLLTTAWVLSEKNNSPVADYFHALINTGSESEIVVKVASDDDAREVILPDGSKVKVSPGSELRYPKIFEKSERLVSLTGQAFFDITRDTKRPFKVFTDELVTEVLGTSFTVTSFEKERRASVAVRTGRVSVYTQSEAWENGSGAMHHKSGLILYPNQQAVFHRKEARLIKTIVENPQRLLPAGSPVHFDEVAAADVFHTLQEVYGIDIVFNEDVFAACQLTADLTGLSLYDQLDMICRILKSRYEVIDAQVIIHGQGCEATATNP